MKKDRIYVTPDDNITVNENNLVNLDTASGEHFEKLEPRRLFPVSRANNYITLLDEEGVEIAIIKSLMNLNKESLEVIEYSLNDYYLVPHIERILSVSEKNGKIERSNTGLAGKITRPGYSTDYWKKVVEETGDRYLIPAAK